MTRGTAFHRESVWGSGLIITALNGLNSKLEPPASPDGSASRPGGVSGFGMALLLRTGFSARHEGVGSGG